MTEHVHTLEEAIALKKRLAEERETDAPKFWRAISFAGPLSNAAQWLNTEPAQGPGEASISRSSGADVTDVLYYA